MLRLRRWNGNLGMGTPIWCRYIRRTYTTMRLSRIHSSSRSQILMIPRWNGNGTTTLRGRGKKRGCGSHPRKVLLLLLMSWCQRRLLNSGRMWWWWLVRKRRSILTKSSTMRVRRVKRRRGKLRGGRKGRRRRRKRRLGEGRLH